MAVKAQWSFDHLPTNLAPGVSCAGLGIPGAAWTFDSDPGGNGSSFLISSGALWFASTYSSYYSGGTTLCSRFTVPITNLQDLTKPHSVIGVRITPSSVTAATNLLALLTGSTYIPLVTLNDAALGLVAAKAYYFEVVFDRINNQFQVYVNNVLKKTAAYDPTTVTSATKLVVGPSTAWVGNNQLTVTYRDWLFIDDTQDATPCTRQGPGTARPAALVAATAPSWVSSDSATPLADLTSPITTGLTATPNITGPASQTPITGQFQTAADPSLPIVCVTAVVSSSNPSANNGKLNGQWSLNGQTASAGQVSYPDTTMQWSQPLGPLSAAPDGAAWTVAKLQAASLIATPAGS